jgi:hypothetical protein
MAMSSIMVVGNSLRLQRRVLGGWSQGLKLWFGIWIYFIYNHHHHRY